MTLRLHGDELFMSCNEVGMSPMDVFGICSVGDSTKKFKKYPLLLPLLSLSSLPFLSFDQTIDMKMGVRVKKGLASRQFSEYLALLTSSPLILSVCRSHTPPFTHLIWLIY